RVQVQGGRDATDRVHLVPFGEDVARPRDPALPWPGALPSPAPALVPVEPPHAGVLDAAGRPGGRDARLAVSRGAAPARSPGARGGGPARDGGAGTGQHARRRRLGRAVAARRALVDARAPAPRARPGPARRRPRPAPRERPRALDRGGAL